MGLCLQLVQNMDEYIQYICRSVQQIERDTIHGKFRVTASKREFSFLCFHRERASLTTESERVGGDCKSVLTLCKDLHLGVFREWPSSRGHTPLTTVPPGPVPAWWTSQREPTWSSLWTTSLTPWSTISWSATSLRWDTSPAHTWIVSFHFFLLFGWDSAY